jgi:uncharacterized protein YaaW (UPF0174 family)
MSDQPQLGVDTPPAVPDGIGLDLESVRTLLAQKHATVVAPDDPVLMLVTLQNAFLAEYEKLLDRHNKALTAILADKTDGYVAEVLTATKGLAKDFSTASVENIRTILQGHIAALTAFRQNLTWLAAIVTVSALVNVTVFALRARG